MTRLPTALALLAALLAVLAADVGAQPPGAPGRQAAVTVTRLVKLFGELENDWLTAVRDRDEATLKTLLSEDFEMRLASRPGDPIPRAEWIAHALGAPPFSGTIQEMAARDLGCTVIVSFRLEPGADVAGARPVLVVDTWVQAQGVWKVAARYVGPSDERPLGLPGERPGLGSPTKKY